MRLQKQVNEYFFIILDVVQPGGRHLLFATTEKGYRSFVHVGPVTQTSCCANSDVVPWYIAYALSFSSKRIYGTPRRLSISSVSRHIDQWMSRIRWRELIRDAVSVNPWWAIVRLKFAVAPCDTTDNKKLERVLSRSAATSKQAYIGSFFFLKIKT